MNKTPYELPFDVAPLSYTQALERLHQALHMGIDPKLETVIDMLAELGNPDAHFMSVQIAGTNGKTSTSRYTAAILKAHGYKTGLYTSPELVSYTERIEVDGQVITEELFGWGVAAAAQAGERVNTARTQAGEKPYDITEFDLLTVAAACIYAREAVEVVALECGLGGRWDATTAFTNRRVVGITGVGLDHTRILGDTLEAIAGEKAAIIHAGARVVLGEGTRVKPSVEHIFLEQCERFGLTPIKPHFEILRVPKRLGFPLELTVSTPHNSYPELSALKPSYQAQNIAMAVALAEQAHAALTEAHGTPTETLNLQHVYDAVISCPTPGRFQVLGARPIVLIDAAHNPQSISAMLTALDEFVPEDEPAPALLFAALADKDVDRMVLMVSEHFSTIYVTQTQSPRALPAPKLAEKFISAGTQPKAVFSTVKEAIEGMKGISYIATGSITLAGEMTKNFVAPPPTYE